MSMGCPKPKTDFLFFFPQEVYRHRKKSEFYERLGTLLDLSFVREIAAPLYSEKIGRPSIDPVVFFKILLIGFLENIDSSIELEFRIADSTVFRDYLGYLSNEPTPDESTLRKTLQRYPEEALIEIFDRILELCHTQGLIMGRFIGHDSSKIDANAGIQSLVHKETGIRYTEYLATLKKGSDDTQEEEKQSESSSTEKFNETWVSETDPDARVAKHTDGHKHLSYKANIAVDLETQIILSARAGFADIHDQQDFLPHIDRARESLEKLGFNPYGVVADKGYHSAENLAAIAERNLVSFISSPSQSHRWTEGFSPSDFRHDPQTDELICPNNKRLPLRRVTKTYRLYRAMGSVCRACPFFGEGKCTYNKRQGRSVKYTIYDDLVAQNRQRVRSHFGGEILWARMQSCESPFGWLKRHAGLHWFAGHGLANANKMVIIGACGWNLLKVVLSCFCAGHKTFLHLIRAISAQYQAWIELVIQQDQNIGSLCLI